MDDQLPFTRKRLKEILEDNYVADLFHEKQWEFSVPLLLGQIIPRYLEPETILPYVVDEPFAAGSYESVLKIEFHPSYRPQGFDPDTTVGTV